MGQGLEHATDAVVRITTTAMCRVPGLTDGAVTGHEAVGEVTAIGAGVTTLAVGDRVVIPARSGRHDLHARCVRITDAENHLVVIPAGVTDAQAITTAHVFPAAWHAARLAGVQDGDTVAVFGAGPVGRLAILAAYCQGAGAVVAIDDDPARLALARIQQAETIDSSTVEPEKALLEITNGVGVNRVIDTGELDDAQIGDFEPRRYVAELLDLIAQGGVAPELLLPQQAGEPEPTWFRVTVDAEPAPLVHLWPRLRYAVPDRVQLLSAAG